MGTAARAALAVAALVGLLLPAAGVAADGHPEATLTPPYDQGADSGESWSHRDADPDQGRITIVSSYPIPIPLYCPARSEISTLVATHQPTAPVTTDSVVSVEVAEALVDTYGFVTAKVTDAEGTWYGSERLRGPVAGGSAVTVPAITDGDAGLSGTIDVPLEAAPGLARDEQPDLIIEFGLELASACPSVGAGTASFPSVTITY